MTMAPTAPATASFSVALPDERTTQRLAIDIANALERGDLVTLSGDLGTGKTTFARMLIRHFAGDPAIEVPSPTFTLMQIYELAQFPLAHVDLYRLSGPGELAELGFDDLPDGAVVLLEWPDRAAGRPPAARPAGHRARARAQAQTRIPPCPRHRLRLVRAPCRPHGGDAPLHRRERLQRGVAGAHARRCLDPLLRAARARRQACDPDEFAAAARRSAGARRQAL